MTTVLIVEDSAVARELLIHILGADPSIRIVGIARDGEEALQAVARHRPDVITMDIHMPRLDGIEATRRIMEQHPTPIVIVSGSVDPHEAVLTFRAIEAGALAVLRKPEGPGHPDHVRTAWELVQTVKLMAEVKVVRRWPRDRKRAPVDHPSGPVIEAPSGPVRLVALGASTGGPPVLQTILSRLGRTFPAPVAIVQHMAAGFLEGFVEWLGQSSGIPVSLATDGETMLGGRAYVAPDGFQMKVERGGRLALTTDEPASVHRPSVSSLFRSAAEVYGSLTVAALLTGMGRDGANELKLLRQKGAVTFAQDKATSIVHGMPGEAIRLHAAVHVLSPEEIASALIALTNDRK